MEATSGLAPGQQGLGGHPLSQAPPSVAWVTWHSQADNELRNQVIKQVVSAGGGQAAAPQSACSLGAEARPGEALTLRLARPPAYRGRSSVFVGG